MIRHDNAIRKPQPKNYSPSIDEIPDLWREAVALESIAPARLRGGLARARTALLASVPAWRLPEILDSLKQEATA